MSGLRSIESALENGGDHSRGEAVDLYPLDCYYFGFRAQVPFNHESKADRIMRMRANDDAYGMRKCVAAVLLVELFNHPHILLLQIRNSIIKLPGGRLRPNESDVACLKRKLSSKLSDPEDNSEGNSQWEIGECLGVWWKPDFEAPLYPHLPPNVKRPVECTKLYLVKLPESRRFIVPKTQRLIAVPLCRLHDSEETYGTVISGIPQLLSNFSFNFVTPGL